MEEELKMKDTKESLRDEINHIDDEIGHSSCEGKLGIALE